MTQEPKCPKCDEEILLENTCCGYYNSGEEIISVKDIVPKAGMGATRIVGSDRYAYTIVEVINNKKIVVVADRAIPYSQVLYTEAQEYDHVKSSGKGEVVTKRKNGYWYPLGEEMSSCGFVIGFRSTYRDPHF